MGFGQAISTCFGKYATFSGRARRAEYWFFYLFNVLVYVALGILSAVVMGIVGAGAAGGNADQAMAAIGAVGAIFYVIQGLYSLAVLLPGLGVAVRRLHDVNRSGWWLLIMLIPLAGFIVLLIWFCSEGTPGPNDHGADPLGRAPAAPLPVPPAAPATP